ncbi:MAG: glycosyltransferase family 9 protein [Aquificaceae bacterium]|nr:glycosyltransferase family 9 protein [Aquificaceae bacterium]
MAEKRALIVRLSSLGDVVLTSCLIAPLLELGYRPHLLTFYPYGEVFAEDTRLQVIQVSKQELFQRETLKRLRGFDLYLDLQKNLRTFLLRLKLRGRWKSYSKESLRRRLALYFPSLRREYSVVRAYLRTVGYTHGRPHIRVSERTLKGWKERLGENYVCIAPGARYAKKRYPYFDKVAELLEGKGYRVVWVGDRGDRELCKGWVGRNLCGELPLREVPALIAGAKLFLGNDSGLLHVARAVGTKAVQVYGGTHPTLGFALEEDEGVYVLRGLYCQPCDLHGKGGCRLGEYPYPCLQIDPVVVFERALRLLPSYHPSRCP